MSTQPLSHLIRTAIRQQPTCWWNRNQLVITVWLIYEPSCAYDLPAVASCLPSAEAVLRAFDRLRHRGLLRPPDEEES